MPESPVAGSQTGADGRRASPFLDTSRPNIARVYDYWLGGKDNFEADRAEAEKLLLIFPGLRQLVRVLVAGLYGRRGAPERTFCRALPA